MNARLPRFALLLVALACGCTSPPPPTEWGPAPEARGPVLALAPIAVGYSSWRDVVAEDLEERPTDDEGEARNDDDVRFTPPYRPSVDAAALTQRVAHQLEGRGGFKRVVTLPTWRGERAPSPSELRRAAQEAGAQWLLEIDLDDASTRLKRKNGLHGVKIGVLIVSSLLIFPAVDPLNWFLPGEDYETTYFVRYRISDVKGDPVASGSLELGAWESFAALPPAHHREFYVIGFLRTPGCLDAEAWGEIHADLAERAEHELLVGLVHGVEAGAAKRSEPPN